MCCRRRAPSTHLGQDGLPPTAMGLLSRITGNPAGEATSDAGSSSSSSSSSSSRDGTSERGGLRRYDTSAFTLHENCGEHAREVRLCLLKHNSTPDPVAQQERNWVGLEECRALWIDYQTCGKLFFKSVTQAHTKCSAEEQAFKECNGKKDCEIAEVPDRCHHILS